jgi:hypothetical protein
MHSPVPPPYQVRHAFALRASFQPINHPPALAQLPFGIAQSWSGNPLSKPARSRVAGRRSYAGKE